MPINLMNNVFTAWLIKVETRLNVFLTRFYIFIWKKQKHLAIQFVETNFHDSRSKPHGLLLRRKKKTLCKPMTPTSCIYKLFPYSS